MVRASARQALSQCLCRSIRWQTKHSDLAASNCFMASSLHRQFWPYSSASQIRSGVQRDLVGSVHKILLLGILVNPPTGRGRRDWKTIFTRYIGQYELEWAVTYCLVDTVLQSTSASPSTVQTPLPRCTSQYELMWDVSHRFVDTVLQSGSASPSTVQSLLWSCTALKNV
jgi:hypothetical protein